MKKEKRGSNTRRIPNEEIILLEKWHFLCLRHEQHEHTYKHKQQNNTQTYTQMAIHTCTREWSNIKWMWTGKRVRWTIPKKKKRFCSDITQYMQWNVHAHMVYYHIFFTLSILYIDGAHKHTCAAHNRVIRICALPMCVSANLSMYMFHIYIIIPERSTIFFFFKFFPMCAAMVWISRLYDCYVIHCSFVRL